MLTKCEWCKGYIDRLTLLSTVNYHTEVSQAAVFSSSGAGLGSDSSTLALAFGLFFSLWHFGQEHQKPYNSLSIFRLSSLSMLKLTYGSVSSSPGLIVLRATMVKRLVPLTPAGKGGGSSQGRADCGGGTNVFGRFLAYTACQPDRGIMMAVHGSLGDLARRNDSNARARHIIRRNLPDSMSPIPGAAGSFRRRTTSLPPRPSIA